MKKLIILITLSLILITGCGSEKIVEIDEKMFITQTDDIYINQDEYLGQTVHYEGLFEIYPPEDGFPAQYYVIRRAPGCCGDDGKAGFEILWDGELPLDNDWVEITGTIQLYSDEGYERLVVKATALTVLPTRGQEFVTQ